ncbi:NACHT, LRR and PYD domains-containing protein 12-like [Strongylocentrotus purpuratus]|uniref:NACHT domain-containing protein n=1 Tax=Strongylocentrotus purpuratus TaxID=7668 RepID=A0A7M7NY95_STRPU|nr:NACHT, LRR and PYD domains-containing protein 12-like [Strongylocentrotus purpuratus]
MLYSFSSGDDEAMKGDFMKLREQLKSRYRKKFGQIKTSPVNPESRTWLQHIYVSLVLMLGLEGEREKPIDYDGLFKFIKTDTPKGFVTRLAFIGEAGVGKSTLFAKIALDWAEGKILQEINLLFLESFREIKESEFFGDTVMSHFPDDLEVKGEWVDEYIRKNQRKVLILLDGLDEAQIDIKKPHRNDAIVSIVRGERFIDTPVVITTRPFGADQIKSIMAINDHYTFGKVKGFAKENMTAYIKNYFKDDSDSASTLINFIDKNQVVSEYMAPFPIFCSMLCSLWKTPSGRENFQTMETFSQLLKRLVFSLQEQYFSKPNDLEEGYESRIAKASESMKDISCIAFQGLLVKQLIFDEKALDSCKEAAMTACEVGILSKEIRPAPLQIRESQRKQFIQEFSFPHKLLQEYIASFYLASLFNEDRQEFNRILADTLLEDYKEFRYVLYFTAAHGGEVGKSILEVLCKKVDDTEFIIQCAFECHNSEAIDPVRNLLKTEATLKLTSSLSNAAFLFTLEPIGKEVVRRSSSIRETLGVSESFEATASSSDVAAAVGLFTLQTLREVTIRTELDNKFYTGMSAAAPQSMIEELSHWHADLGSAASSHYARGLCSMPNLRSLYMYSAMKLSDEFYSTMATEASKSNVYPNTICIRNNSPIVCILQTEYLDEFFHIKNKIEIHLFSLVTSTFIEKLSHWHADLGSAASSHYARGLCFMPKLRSLTLGSLKLSDEFYSTMVTEASNSKIEELNHWSATLGSAASSHYVRGLCSMPNLRSLGLYIMELSDNFYSTMATEASKSNIEKVNHWHADLGSHASFHYARGLFSMPNLRSLDLSTVKLKDEFYSTMATEASKLKIEELEHSNADLGPAASSHYARGLCFMPNLRSLKLFDVKLSDKFYSTMASEASISQTSVI